MLEDSRNCVGCVVEEQRGGIDVVLILVVTDNLRVHRLSWTPEYHRDIQSPTKTLHVSTKSFLRHAFKAEIEELQEDVKT
ncbi:hypothetical protein G7Y89_g7590 [Cudoniella acicularis]|uniref:Uncharacterized protein n=1 Tax=Cudoniella acicularis TaxID=354080 RepID=A0A8H4RKX8_9HELO|nr:hypothetical protein G7Y89_g7590 [Cudoniella acicularis]